MKIIKYILVFAICFFSLLSCKKNWIEIKPDKSLTIPATLQDAQALLDNPNFRAQTTLGEVGSDNFYNSEAILANYDVGQINQYLWAENGYGVASIQDWDISYQSIFYTNKVLEILRSIPVTSDNQAQWDNEYGCALFLRAFKFYSLAQVFSRAYDKNSASADLGIPLRLEANINQIIGRSTVLQTYDQIINDLTEAKGHLPATQSYKTRPTKTAVCGLLARVYLSMEEYDKSFAWSDSCLRLNNSLLDYNTLNASASFPIPTFAQNPEVILYATTLNYPHLSQSRMTVDSVLYSSFDNNDLRLSIFFTNNPGRIVFKGGYTTGNLPQFSGLAVDEMYLIRAECYARKGDAVNAMADLNTLLIKRWKSGTFIPFSASNAEDALRVILTERRKELIFRTLRWEDLRRLNRDSRFAITLKKLYNGQTYTLPPGDNKYVWPIPDNEILFSGIPQNPR